MGIMLHDTLAGWGCVLRDGASVLHLLFPSLNNHLQNHNVLKVHLKK